MSLDKQIEKTKSVVEGGVSLSDHQSKLILENQLVILETLKKLVVKVPHVSDIVPM